MLTDGLTSGTVTRNAAVPADGLTPGTVSRHAAVPDTLPVGAPGKVGVLELGFAHVGGRTELTRHVQKAPLHTTRPLYPDPDRPHMPHVLFMSSGGGILQGDRYRIELDCGPDTAVHFTTQTATRLYRMEHDYATQTVELRAARNSYVEYLPETTIPFGGSRFYQHMNVIADPEATVVIGEKLMIGRLARGERHAYTVYCTDLEVRAPDGRTLFADPLRLVPSEHSPAGPATVVIGEKLMIGRLARGERHAYTVYCTDLEVRDPDGRTLFADPLRLVPSEHSPAGPATMDDFGVTASLYVLTPRARETADAMHDTIAATGLHGGASLLPDDCGAWARILGDRSPEVEAAYLRTCEAVREALR